jgi:solute carrier family 6 GABA transporter-like protein 1
MSEPVKETPATTTETESRFALKLKNKEDHGEWSSRGAFYMAAVGAAVGFGNVWRFPSLAVDYGGGAFFIPYLMALIFLGIPLAILEIGFGQYFQTGDIGVFGGFHPRLRGVGLASVGCGFMLDTYYVVLISWVANAFFSTWSPDAPWNNPDLNGGDAVGYFVNDIIGASTVATDGPDALKPTRLVWRNVGFMFMTWFIIFLCVAWGVKWTGRIACATMGLPILFLFIFLGKGLSLEGSGDGVREYIGIWDMSVLSERGEVWSVACSQIFFSISLTFGILTAYGSHCPRSEPAALNATVISLANSLFSFIVGFAVFAALGHLAFLENKEVKDLTYGGFGLVFGTWPVVFNKLPGGIHWVRLIFFNLFLLGIDSAFAFLEAFITVMQDTVYFEKVPRFWLAVGVSIVGFLFSLMYCTDAGLNYLDAIDFYINFVMILVGFFEAFGSAWAYDIIGQLERQSAPVVYSFMTANFGAVILGCILWYTLPADSAVWGGFVGYFVWYFVFVGVTGYFISIHVKSSDGKWTMGAMWYEVYFGNIVALRDRMKDVIGGVPFIWCVLMKHFIPHVLIILFVNLAQTKNDDGKPKLGNYGDYPRPYQVLGCLVVAFTLVLFLVGVFLPDLYAPLALPQTEEAKQELEKYATAGAAMTTEKPKDVEEIPEKDNKIENTQSVEKDA